MLVGAEPKTQSPMILLDPSAAASAGWFALRV